ncbi:MAG: hypothetical protein K2Y37_22435 [Pirellulales bacterium]|nr:hypothetical protein [Pirellulales bacterium]
MTLEAYNQQRIDELSLRVLEVATSLRNMARLVHENGLQRVAMHDKKALEWLAKLEDWALKSQAALELAAHRTRGARRAAEVATPAKRTGKRK